MNSRPTTDFVNHTSSNTNKSNQNYDSLTSFLKGDMAQFKYPMQTVLDNQTMASARILSCEHDYYSAYFKEKNVLK